MVCILQLWPLFVCFDVLHPSQQFVGTVLPGFNHYTEQHIKCLAQGHNTVTPSSNFGPCVHTNSLPAIVICFANSLEPDEA